MPRKLGKLLSALAGYDFTERDYLGLLVELSFDTFHGIVNEGFLVVLCFFAITLDGE